MDQADVLRAVGQDRGEADWALLGRRILELAAMATAVSLTNRHVLEETPGYDSGQQDRAGGV